MSSAIRIVLVDTSHPGNIGASARAMMNMGLDALVLVRPQSHPDPEAIARRLAVSLRSLQRKLADEGTSFAALLDETRSTLARGYLDEDRYSVSEITYLLGFAGVSAFSHAFKRWTGSSPSAYRRKR